MSNSDKDQHSPHIKQQDTPIQQLYEKAQEQIQQTEKIEQDLDLQQNNDQYNQEELTEKTSDLIQNEQNIKNNEQNVLKISKLGSSNLQEGVGPTIARISQNSWLRFQGEWDLMWVKWEETLEDVQDKLKKRENYIQYLRNLLIENNCSENELDKFSEFFGENNTQNIKAISCIQLPHFNKLFDSCYQEEMHFSEQFQSLVDYSIQMEHVIQDYKKQNQELKQQISSFDIQLIQKQLENIDEETRIKEILENNLKLQKLVNQQQDIINQDADQCKLNQFELQKGYGILQDQLSNYEEDQTLIQANLQNKIKFILKEKEYLEEQLKLNVCFNEKQSQFSPQKITHKYKTLENEFCQFADIFGQQIDELIQNNEDLQINKDYSFNQIQGFSKTSYLPEFCPQINGLQEKLDKLKQLMQSIKAENKQFKLQFNGQTKIERENEQLKIQKQAIENENKTFKDTFKTLENQLKAAIKERDLQLRKAEEAVEEEMEQLQEKIQEKDQKIEELQNKLTDRENKEVKDEHDQENQQNQNQSQEINDLQKQKEQVEQQLRLVQENYKNMEKEMKNTVSIKEKEIENLTSLLLNEKEKTKNLNDQISNMESQFNKHQNLIQQQSIQNDFNQNTGQSEDLQNKLRILSDDKKQLENEIHGLQQNYKNLEKELKNTVKQKNDAESKIKCIQPYENMISHVQQKFNLDMQTGIYSDDSYEEEDEILYDKEIKFLEQINQISQSYHELIEDNKQQGGQKDEQINQQTKLLDQLKIEKQALQNENLNTQQNFKSFEKQMKQLIKQNEDLQKELEIYKNNRNEDSQNKNLEKLIELQKENSELKQEIQKLQENNELNEKEINEQRVIDHLLQDDTEIHQQQQMDDSQDNLDEILNKEQSKNDMNKSHGKSQRLEDMLSVKTCDMIDDELIQQKQQQSLQGELSLNQAYIQSQSQFQNLTSKINSQKECSASDTNNNSQNESFSNNFNLNYNKENNENYEKIIQEITDELKQKENEIQEINNTVENILKEKQHIQKIVQELIAENDEKNSNIVALNQELSQLQEQIENKNNGQENQTHNNHNDLIIQLQNQINAQKEEISTALAGKDKTELKNQYLQKKSNNLELEIKQLQKTNFDLEQLILQYKISNNQTNLNGQSQKNQNVQFSQNDSIKDNNNKQSVQQGLSQIQPYSQPSSPSKRNKQTFYSYEQVIEGQKVSLGSPKDEQSINQNQNSNLDQIYKQCIQRSKNLLLKNEQLITSLNNKSQNQLNKYQQQQYKSKTQTQNMGQLLTNNVNQVQLNDLYFLKSKSTCTGQQQEDVMNRSNPSLKVQNAQDSADPTKIFSKSGNYFLSPQQKNSTNKIIDTYQQVPYGKYNQQQLQYRPQFQPQQQGQIIAQKYQQQFKNEPQQNYVSQKNTFKVVNFNSNQNQINSKSQNIYQGIQKQQQQQQQQQQQWSQYQQQIKNQNNELNKVGNQIQLKQQQFYNYQLDGEYQGDKIRGVKQGKGRQIYLNGYIYEGDFKNNVRHGFGILKNNKGMEIYQGYWENDEYNGSGKLINQKKISFDHPLKYENLGQIQTIWSQYNGQIKNGVFQGQGQLIFANNEKFIGNFNGGNLHGKGTFYRKNGEQISGIWLQGVYKGKQF